MTRAKPSNRERAVLNTLALARPYATDEELFDELERLIARRRERLPEEVRAGHHAKVRALVLDQLAPQGESTR